jgi:hypothetical protein
MVDKKNQCIQLYAKDNKFGSQEEKEEGESGS